MDENERERGCRTVAPAAPLAATNAVVSLGDVLANEGIWDRAQKIGRALMKTSYLGRGTSEFGATMAVITMAKNNMDPVEFSRAFNMINDKPEMKPNYALGLFRRAGGRYRIVRADDDVCEMEFSACGEPPFSVRVEMAKILKTDIPWTTGRDGARVLKSNWANHPDDMLFARCTGKGLRRIAPEVMGGGYLAGEVDHDAPAAPAAPRAALSAADAAARAKAAALPASASAKDAPVTVDADVVAERAPEEAAQQEARVAPEAAKAEAAPAAPEGPADPAVCPIEGPYLGRRFAEIEPDILAYLLEPSVANKHPELTPAHVAEARAAFEKATGGAK